MKQKPFSFLRVSFLSLGSMLFTASIPERALSQVVDEQNVREQANRNRAKQLCSSLRFEKMSNSTWTLMSLSEDAVMSFGDLVRNDKSGSVWTWGLGGRPQVVAELYEDAFGKWTMVVCNTSGTQLRPAESNRLQWRPNRSELQMQDVPDAPAVEDQPSLRSRQLKRIANDFRAHQFWDPNDSRYELRMLPRPIAVYSDPSEGILDGAMFSFAHETNPELLLFLEARKGSQTGGWRWQFGVGKLAHAELHLQYQDKEVFQVPRVRSATPPESPYYLEYIHDWDKP